MSEPIPRWPLAILPSIGFVLVPPLVTVLGFYVDHALDYRGFCGPYPTDIPAYPCLYSEYSSAFFGGFSGFAFPLAMRSLTIEP